MKSPNEAFYFLINGEYVAMYWPEHSQIERIRKYALIDIEDQF